MPHAPKQCHICGRWCPRNRALRFHIEKSHPGAAAPNTDDWLDEPLCSIDVPQSEAPVLPDIPTTLLTTNDTPTVVPNHGDTEDGEPPAKKLALADLSDNHPAVVDHGADFASTTTVVSNRGDDVSRIADTIGNRNRRGLRRSARLPASTAATQTATRYPQPPRWGQYLRGERLRTIPYGYNEMPSSELTEFAEYLSPSSRRQLCDCFRCVQHAILVTETTFAFRSPFRVPPTGVQFVNIPSVRSASSTSQRLELNRLLDASPHQATYACGCQTCVVHRCAVRSLQLVASTPLPTSEVERAA